MQRTELNFIQKNADLFYQVFVIGGALTIILMVIVFFTPIHLLYWADNHIMTFGMDVFGEANIEYIFSIFGICFTLLWLSVISYMNLKGKYVKEGFESFFVIFMIFLIALILIFLMLIPIREMTHVLAEGYWRSS